MAGGGCPACRHLDIRTVDRFLVLPAGTPGKRGPRSLSRDFGLDRRAIARHARECLVGVRREEVLQDIERLVASRGPNTETRKENR